MTRDEEIAELQAQIAELDERKRLEASVDKAAAEYEANPTPEKYAAHCRAQEALSDIRAKRRGKLKITADLAGE